MFKIQAVVNCILHQEICVIIQIRVRHQNTTYAVYKYTVVNCILQHEIWIIEHIKIPDL